MDAGKTLYNEQVLLRSQLVDECEPPWRLEQVQVYLFHNI